MQTTPAEKEPMEAQIKQFVDFVKSVMEAQYAKFNYVPAPSITLEEGRRYIRIVTNGSQRMAYGFLDKTNGDVLMTATWKAPAKHARANLNAPEGWAKAVGPYGIAYLR